MTAPRRNSPLRPSISMALAFAALLTASAGAGASDIPEVDPGLIDHVPEPARTAILRFMATDLEDWHYTRNRVGEDGALTDRHDPDRPGAEHWQLVSVDGRAPTERERRVYEKDRADHSDPEERANREEMLQVLAPGSVRPVDGPGPTRRFAYRLRSPDGKREEVYESLAGEMLVADSHRGPWVREVRLWNVDVLRPFLGARIDEAELRFEFAVEDDGWVVPVTVEASWAGEFLLVKDLSTALRFSLTDFRRADAPRDAGPEGDAVALP